MTKQEQERKDKTIKNLKVLHEHMLATGKTPRMEDFFLGRNQWDAYSWQPRKKKSKAHYCKTSACLMGEATRLFPITENYFHVIDGGMGSWSKSYSRGFDISTFGKDVFPWLYKVNNSDFDCTIENSKWYKIFDGLIPDDKAVENLGTQIKKWST